MPKLTLTPELEEQVNEILAPLKNPHQWKELELSFAPSPSAVVLMIGEPGTGKSALCDYMARKASRKAPLHLQIASVAGSQFGETEGKIKALFDSAHETETTTLIMEECDALLWSRDMVKEDTMYVLGIINTLLTEIDKFVGRQIPSLLVLTTNYPRLLDAALQRRITDRIELFPPVGANAIRMWKSKLPECILKEITKEDLHKLAELGATPDQMEKAILKVCRKAMHNDRLPIFADFEV